MKFKLFAIIASLTLSLAAMQENDRSEKIDPFSLSLLHNYGCALPKKIYAKGTDSPIVKAVVLEDAKKIKLLLTDTETKINEKKTALSLAVERRNFSIINLLLSHDVNPLSAYSVLCAAMAINGQAIRQHLQTYSQLRHFLEEKLQLKLVHAVKIGDCKEVHTLLTRGINPNGVFAHNGNFRSCLWLAATHLNPITAYTMTMLLLQFCANPDTYDSHATSLIEHILNYHDRPLVKSLSEK